MKDLRNAEGHTNTKKIKIKIGSYGQIPGRAFISLLGLPLVLVVMMVIVGIIEPRFLQITNLTNVLRQASVLWIVASGEMFVLLVGGLDISVGTMIAAVSVITTVTILSSGIVTGIFVGLVFAAVVGTLNGAISAYRKIPGFIVTLGMYSVLHGLALLISNGQSITGMPKSFTFLGNGHLMGLPVPFWVSILVLIGSHIALTQTKWGRYLYATGGNEEAARISGINTTRIKISAYITCSLLAGLGGIVLTSRVSSGQPNLGMGLELDAIAGAIVGGVAIRGGEGTAFGVAMGVAIMAVLRNGLNLANISSYYQMVITGGIIVGALLLAQVRKDMSE